MNGVASNTNAQQQSETTLFTIVESIFRHTRLLLGVFVVTLILGLLFAFLPHAKYESEMILLIQNGRASPTISAGTTPVVPPEEVSDAQISSQIEVMNSNDVLDEVVDPGWNSVPIEQRSAEAIGDHISKVGAFRSRMNVNPGKKSHTLLVEYRSNSPRDSYDALQKLLPAFLDKERDLGQPAQAPKFFAAEAERYHNEWQAAQADLVKFRVTHNLIAMPDEEALSGKQLFELQSELQAADVLVHETESRLISQRAERASQPQRVVTSETSGDLISLEALHTQEVTLQLKRTELLTKFLPTDRLVQEADKQLAQLKAAIDSTKNRRSSSVTTAVNPTWQAVDVSLTESQSILAGAQARRRQLAAEIAEMNHQLSTIAADSATYGILQGKVTELQANYDINAKKRDEAIANGGMDAARLLNVAVVEAPSYSPFPVRPRPIQDTLLALFTALFVSGLVLFFAELSRSTFTSARDLDALNARDVLATVPLAPRS